MELQIISHERLIAERDERRRRATWAPGRHTVLDHAGVPIPMQRLITTSDGLAAFAEKVTLDVNEGREERPLLYEPLYAPLKSDDLPRVIDLNLISSGQAVFLLRTEGGEVEFGHMAPGSPATVTLVNYSAGFEYTSEMVEFDETWRLEELNRSFGEAYNALLNHLHLSPILTFPYAAANQTPADATGATLIDKTRLTLRNAITTAITAKRPGSILLANSVNRWQLEDAMAKRYDNVGNALPGIDVISTIIYYDGHTLTVGPKTYTYAGVTAGKVYLIQPKRYLRELVRTKNGQDMFVETGNADLSRRIEDQIAAHTYRQVYVDVDSSTEEITLP